MLKNYDLLFSVGNSCFASDLLRSCKLQFESYPFDWLLFKSWDNVINLWENNFNDFICKDYLEKEDEVGKIHNQYFNNKYQVRILHDFLIGVDFDTAFNTVYQRYQRRINRLKQRIEAANSILMVHCEDNSELSNAEISTHFERLKKIIPNKHLDLIFIDLRLDLKEKRTEVISPNITRFYTPDDSDVSFGTNVQRTKYVLKGICTSKKVKFLQTMRSIALYTRKVCLKIFCLLPMPKTYKTNLKRLYKDKFRA